MGCQVTDIKAKLAAAIDLQQAEVSRLQTVADDALPAAKVKLKALKDLKASVKPADEALIATLIDAGIVKE